MPLHDWTRVNSGTYHAFHNAWITHLQEALNEGLLPQDYYALGEQRAGDTGPDVLALHETNRRRTLVIRHVKGDRIVARIEIVSPANKHNRAAVADFVDGVLAALRTGIHVLVIDPFPPGRHDPHGMHAAIWEELGEPAYEPPADCPLTLVSYCAKSAITAHIEPTRVGVALIDMPLFLTNEHYVPTPLEKTYMQAWAGVPQRWQRVLVA